MARFCADENFPLPAVVELRKLGRDATTIHESGRAGEAVSDSEVLRLAAEEGRAVVTINRKDFIRLHRRNTDHAGIVACTDDVDFVALAVRIHQTVAEYEDLHGRLIRVVRPNS
ncbi:MAG: DUF5615 family PIN-like protein [Planctomycetia bacterium]